MKEYLFQKRKLLRRFLKRQMRTVRRFFLNTGLNLNESFNIPVIINNRNRLEWLEQLVAWLKQSGYTNIYVLDNDSTYPPLLEYYKAAQVKVIKLDYNGGYMSLWSTPFFKQIRKGYYVYTDPDVLPGPGCPADVVYRLYKVLLNHKKIEKCGVALRIDDLPDHYARKSEVIETIEGRYWTKPVEPHVYDAPVDTTFALYRPLAFGNAEECRAYRLGGECTWRHMPWYENSADPGNETLYYLRHADSSSSWYKKGPK